MIWEHHPVTFVDHIQHFVIQEVGIRVLGGRVAASLHGMVFLLEGPRRGAIDNWCAIADELSKCGGGRMVPVGEVEMQAVVLTAFEEPIPSLCCHQLGGMRG